MLARGPSTLGAIFRNAWRLLCGNFLLLYGICLAPGLFSWAMSLVPQPLGSLAVRRVAALTLARFAFAVVGYLLVALVAWSLWVSAFRVLARREVARAATAWREAQFGRVALAGLGFLTVPVALMTVLFFVALATALALGLASLLGHWILYVLSPAFAAFFLATLVWAAGMLSLASAVLVLTEATGLNAVGIALRRARNHALSLTLLTGLMALATLVLVTVALGIFAATHPDLVSSFAKLWRIPAAASTRAEWFSAFSRISDSRSLSALQTVLVPVFSAYTSTAFIVWFAGTEAAPTAPVAPPSLTPSDTPASRPFTAPLPGVDHV